MNPLVSVILPCFNTHEYLGQAIASIRAQTVNDVEIIVVNDGSTNQDTLSYLLSLPSDIRIITQNNKGLPAARNTGFKASMGRFVVPLDCDDWIAPEFIEKGLALLHEHPDDNAFAYSYIGLEGDQVGTLRKNYNFFDQMFFNQIPYCILISKTLWEKSGGYDETMLSGYEDWEFNLRLGKVGIEGLVITQPLFHYRVRKQGMLQSVSLRRHSQLWRSIQNRHQSLYRLRNLVELWLIWRARPSSRSAAIYFSLFIAHRWLPEIFINWIIEHSRYFSHSSRLQRLSG